MRAWVCSTLLALTACASEPPPLAIVASRRPQTPHPPVTTTPPPAPYEVGLPPIESLEPIEVDGPTETLAGLCGEKCHVAQTLPNLGATKLVLAEGVDTKQRSSTVKTTYFAYKTADGWYGALLFREGDGLESLEIFNPPTINGGAPSRVERPIHYGGLMHATMTVLDVANHGRYVVMSFRESGQGGPFDSLVLCHETEDNPICVQIRTPDTPAIQSYSIANGVMDMTFTDGEAHRFQLP